MSIGIASGNVVMNRNENYVPQAENLLNLDKTYIEVELGKGKLG